MATNVKMKKKKGSYDNRFILILTIALSAVVALVTIIAVWVTLSTNYVAKVGGEKIYTYEFDYFLQEALSDIQTKGKESFPEGFDDMSDEEKAEIYLKFWTTPDENGVLPETKAVDQAMEKARIFKASYLLAKKNGCELTSEEKANTKSTIDYYINYYYQYYSSQSSSVTYEDVVKMYCGNMTLKEYKNFALQNTAISKYKEKLKEKYDVSDEELRKIYDEDPDSYRELSIRKLFFAMPVDSDDKPLETDSDEYKAILERAQKIVETLNKGEKYTELLYDEDGNVVKDDDGNDKYWAKDADFVELIKSQSDESGVSSSGGLSTVNGKTTSLPEELLKYILGYQWNDDRTAIVNDKVPGEKDDDEDKEDESSGDENKGEDSASSSTSDENKNEDDKDDKEDGDKEEDEKDYSTQLVLVETEKGIYIVRCENIEDFDNSEDSEEGAKDSIKNTILATRMEEMATEELENEVPASSYPLKNRKTKIIQELVDAYGLKEKS